MSDYDRGHIDGGMNERLAGHDRHFMTINGSLARMAAELEGVKLQLQRLADSADADRRTVVTTAAALKDAEAARREMGTERWNPWQKAAVLIGALAAIAAVIAFIIRL